MTGQDVVVEVDVACSTSHAFAVWTERMDVWWPREKSFSGPDRLDRVVMEPHVGGRILEVAVDGERHAWGRVVAWEPPRRLAFTWHLMFPASDATDVEVTFHDVPGGGTRVRVRHGGWERLAPTVAAERRHRNESGWTALLPVFAAAAARPAAPDGAAVGGTPLL